MDNNSLNPHHFGPDLHRLFDPISSSTSLQPEKSEGPSYEWCIAVQLNMATLLGCATVTHFTCYRTRLRPSCSQVRPCLSFTESVSYLHIWSLINQHFVKGFSLPQLLSQVIVPGARCWELSCHWERLSEDFMDFRKWEILNRMHGLGLVAAFIWGFKYVCMGVRCPRLLRNM